MCSFPADHTALDDRGIANEQSGSQRPGGNGTAGFDHEFNGLLELAERGFEISRFARLEANAPNFDVQNGGQAPIGAAATGGDKNVGSSLRVRSGRLITLPLIIVCAGGQK